VLVPAAGIDDQSEPSIETRAVPFLGPVAAAGPSRRGRTARGWLDRSELRSCFILSRAINGASTCHMTAASQLAPNRTMGRGSSAKRPKRRAGILGARFRHLRRRRMQRVHFASIPPGRLIGRLVAGPCACLRRRDVVAGNRQSTQGIPRTTKGSCAMGTTTCAHGGSRQSKVLHAFRGAAWSARYRRQS
jgi:hypothetical protein